MTRAPGQARSVWHPRPFESTMNPGEVHFERRSNPRSKEGSDRCEFHALMELHPPIDITGLTIPERAVTETGTVDLYLIPATHERVKVVYQDGDHRIWDQESELTGALMRLGKGFTLPFSTCAGREHDRVELSGAFRVRSLDIKGGLLQTTLGADQWQADVLREVSLPAAPSAKDVLCRAPLYVLRSDIAWKSLVVALGLAITLYWSNRTSVRRIRREALATKGLAL
jgi:hypothetical protein